MIEVVAALIEKDNKYLIARRSTGNQNVLGKWEFPGGKVEKGEDDIHAIEREIKEEFEINIKGIRFLTSSLVGNINLKLYECKYISGEINLHDHYEYKFVSKDEILNYDLAKADIKLAKYIGEVLK